jgi:type I restriction enzyme S subunit
MISRTTFTDRWSIRPLNEVVEFLDSRRIPVKASERSPGPYPYYGANGQQGTIHDYIFDEPTVLLAEDGGHFGEEGRAIAYSVSGKYWVNNHAHVLRPKPQTDLRYLTRVLENYDVTPFVTGSTRGKLTQGSAQQIPVPLPPLAEQRRIAAILDKADALRQQRRTAHDKLDALLQSIFLDMFGDPVTNPKGWKIAQLNDLVRKGDRINYGVVQPGRDVEKGVPLVRVGDFSNGFIDLTDLKCIEPEIEAKYKRSRLCGDEILVSCVGSIGNIALAEKTMQGFNIARAVARIPLGEGTERAFVASYLRLRSVQSYFQQETRTVSQPTLNIQDIKATKILVPPLELQREFTARAAGFSVIQRHYSKFQEESQRLFHSLQQRAFRGEL